MCWKSYDITQQWKRIVMFAWNNNGIFFRLQLRRPELGLPCLRAPACSVWLPQPKLQWALLHRGYSMSLPFCSEFFLLAWIYDKYGFLRQTINVNYIAFLSELFSINCGIYAFLTTCTVQIIYICFLIFWIVILKLLNTVSILICFVVSFDRRCMNCTHYISFLCLPFVKIKRFVDTNIGVFFVNGWIDSEGFKNSFSFIFDCHHFCRRILNLGLFRC